MLYYIIMLQEERELKKEEEAAKAKAEKKGHKDSASKIPAPKKGKLNKFSSLQLWCDLLDGGKILELL